MTDLEIKILFELIDKYIAYEIDNKYKGMELKNMIIEYAKSRDIALTYVEVF